MLKGCLGLVENSLLGSRDPCFDSAGNMTSPALKARCFGACTTTLAEWDPSEDRQIEDGSEMVTVFEVISIAHEFRLFTILPAVYAKYVGLLPLVASFCHNNAVVSDYYFEQDMVPTNTRKVLEYLSQEDQHGCTLPSVNPSML